MNKFIVAFLLMSYFIKPCVADEGMWLPILLKQLNESDMQSKGCKLSADDIYSINHTSLKDAVVLFGGGCTAEVISSQGLILTNHHCGYGQIQQHSTIENDYLTKGYWAMKKEDELHNPGLSVTFIISMEEVTEKILFNVSDTTNEVSREKIIKQNIADVEKKMIEGNSYQASVKSFYNGNKYYLFMTETFKDVRLVGAPPSSIGKFGSDADNWVWPRHTGDFSLFRIYADKNNKPAEYSKDNVPYTPKFHFTISLTDVKQDDFTMVYGFPGRTTEYLSSYAVDMIRNESNPVKVKLRDKKLNVLDSYMRSNDTIRIKYSAKYATIANYWKKWEGENRGLDKLNAIEKKKNEEGIFLKNALLNNNQSVSNLLLDLEFAYKKFAPINKQRDYYNEAFLAVELNTLATNTIALLNKAEDKNYKKEDLEKDIATFKKGLAGFYKNYDAKCDKQVFVTLMKMYYDDMESLLPKDNFDEVKNKYDLDFNKYADMIYSKSALTNFNSLNKLVEGFPKNISKFKKDPAIKFATLFYTYYNQLIKPTITKLDANLASLNRKYMKAQMEINTTRKFYPDANSTLRVAYGKVNDYFPNDGTHYKYFTTLDGVMEKENNKVDEFKVETKLKQLYTSKDFGQYADADGKLHVAFIASNHTTGGNSGSPVLNAKGELIGTNFDRNWEGTMSDIMYNPNQVRNIIVDVHYTLFVIDKFAGAHHLIDEMTIVK